MNDLKKLALDYAVKCNSGAEFNDFGFATTNPDKIVEAAKKFENYLTGKKED